MKTPNGPFGDDARARPDATILPVKSPRLLTVIRSECPSAPRESENGCDAHQKSRREKAPEEELARRGVQPVEPAPAHAERDDARAFRHDLGDAQPVAERVEERDADAEDDEQRERREVERRPVVRCAVVSSTSSLPVGIWWNQPARSPA